MREFEDRHSRDAGTAGTDALHRHAHDGHPLFHEAASDTGVFRVHDLEYRQRVEAEYAAYNARHAKQQDAHVGHIPAVRADKPASRIAGRDLSRHEKAEKQRSALMGLLRSCFVRTQTWLQAGKYVSALASDLPSRNGWSVAEHAGDRTPGKSQRLLSRASWDEAAAMSQVRRPA